MQPDTNARTGELAAQRLAAARRGDPGARRELVLVYQDRVFHLLRRMLEPSGLGSWIEDLAQEVFLRAFAALDRFDPAGSAQLSTWLLTIATRRAIDLLRTRSRRAVVSFEGAAEALACGTNEASSLTTLAVVRAVGELSPTLRGAFILRTYHGLPYDEIARVLEIEPGTVASRITRARARADRDSAAGATAVPVPADAAAQELSEEERVAREIERCGNSLGVDGCSTIAPSQAVLDFRADCGIVVYDEPLALTNPAPDFTELASLASLDPSEVEALQDVATEFHEDMRSRFEAIYTALGGDPALLPGLSSEGVFVEAYQAIGDEQRAATIRAEELISAFRAGRIPEPDWRSLPPAEQFFYLRLQAGEMFEDAAAARLGPARARELRSVRDGWLGGGGVQGSSDRCSDRSRD